MSPFRPIPVIMLFLLSLALSACSSDSSPIIIGLSGQLTGELADLGVPSRNGAELAIEAVNAAGGINGRKLKLIAKDDGNTPERALQVDQELVAAGAVAVIGHMTSSQTMAVMPFFNENRVVLLSPTASTPILTRKQDYFFGSSWTIHTKAESWPTTPARRLISILSSYLPTPTTPATPNHS